MPALIGLLVGFGLGAALAWIHATARGTPLASRATGSATAVVALFGALVHAPVNAYFLAFAGDWAMSYVVDARAVPSALSLLLVVADAAAVVAGFWLASARARHDKVGPVLALAAAPLALSAVGAVVASSRLSIDGTYHQVRLGFGTRSVAGGPLGYAILWMLAMTFAGFAIAARALRAAPRGRRSARPTAEAPPPVQRAGLEPSAR